MTGSLIASGTPDKMFKYHSSGQNVRLSKVLALRFYNSQ